MKRVVLTGAPGSGKTTLLGALGHLGHVVDEPARELISEHHAATGEHSLDSRPDLFVARLIERSIEKFNVGGPDGAVWFYDRGLPDCIVYAQIFEVDPAPAMKAAERYRYSEPVFVLPPWEGIYHVDDMRRMEFAMAAPFHDALVSAYEALGYDLVELPKSSLAARAQMVSTLVDPTRQ